MDYMEAIHEEIQSNFNWIKSLCLNISLLIFVGLVVLGFFGPHFNDLFYSGSVKKSKNNFQPTPDHLFKIQTRTNPNTASVLYFLQSKKLGDEDWKDVQSFNSISLAREEKERLEKLRDELEGSFNEIIDNEL